MPDNSVQQVNILPNPFECKKKGNYLNVFSLCLFSQRQEKLQPVVCKPKPVTPELLVTTPKAQVNNEEFVNINAQLKKQPPFRAGQISHNLEHWQSLTSDQTILSTVRGFKLDFYAIPSQATLPNQLITDQQEIDITLNLLQELLAKQVIEIVPHNPTGYTSNIFLRQKRNGSHRLILNLKPLNPYVEYFHFKMTTLTSALELITPNCYMASIDLSDAYYSVRVSPSHRKYLQFFFQGTHYRFTCMANGISSAPRTFTKLLKVPLSHLRDKYNITIIAYLDDLLLLSNSAKQLVSDINITQTLLRRLGFYISVEKSVLQPTKALKFLGFMLNSQTMLVTLSPDKPDCIKQMLAEFLSKATTSIRHFAAILGTLAATLPANRYGQIFLKRLETEKAKALKKKSYNYDSKYHISDKTRTELSWWLENIDTASRPIAVKNPSIILYTDASFQGWGCFWPARKFKTGGRWGPQEQDQDINYLELKAVFFALQSCCRDVYDTHILIHSDNTTTVVGINKQGSTHSNNCNDITREIWLWAKERSCWLSSTHCAGKLNTEADMASRIFNDSTEWSLSKTLFKQICQQFGQPTIDMFASRLNYQIEPYCAWQPDPFAQTIDSFTLHWGNYELIYVFPPFSIIGRVLQKITSDKATAVIIVPHWPTQPWFSRLRCMLLEPPRIIHVTERTLHLPHDRSKVHPMSNRLCLWACKISGTITSYRAFHPRPLMSC